VNGKHLSRELVHSSITDMIISGEHLIFGNTSGVVVIKELNGSHICFHHYLLYYVLTLALCEVCICIYLNVNILCEVGEVALL